MQSWVRQAERVRSRGFDNAVHVRADRAVGGRGVGETKLGVLGIRWGGVLLVSRRNRKREVLYELSWHRSPRNSQCVSWVDDLAAGSDVSVLRKVRGVPVGHELGSVPGPFVTGLDGDDGGVAFVEQDDVRAAGQRGGAAPQAEGVLGFSPDVATAVAPFLALLVESRRLAH